MFSSLASSDLFRGSGGRGGGELKSSVTGVPYLEVRLDMEWYGVPAGEGSGWLVMKAS